MMLDPDLPPRPINSFIIVDFRDLLLEARTSRMGVGLVMVGWFHLLIFCFCEVLYTQGDRVPIHFVLVWLLDVVFAFIVLRQRVPIVAGVDPTSRTRVALRVWLTFLLLCLTSASLNTITGFQIEWFKISWSMLGTFAFAMMAWIFHLGFLIPAIQMSMTALLVASYPDHSYLIFGLSWFVVLNAFGLLLEGGRWMFGFTSIVSRRSVVVLKHQSR